MKRLDLLPSDYHRLRSRARWMSRTSWLTLAIALAAGLLAGAWEMRSFHLVSQHAHVAAELSDLKAADAQAQAIQARYEVAMKQAREIDALVPAVPLTAAVALICNTMPDSISLYGLTVETQAREAEADKPDDKSRKRGGRSGPVSDSTIRLTIAGHAREDVQIARFVSALGSAPLLSKVQLGSSRQVEVRGVFMHEFQVTAEIAPNVKLVPETQKVAHGS